jgi:hypothetical protein
MSAFMQGLQTGSQVAQGWMDTYENARKRRQAEMLEQQRQGILTAQPEEFQGYTEQQGQELSRLAESGQVDIGYDQDRGAYTVTPRGLAPEARTPNMTSVVAPQSRRRFLGQDYSPEDLTPTRTQRLREQAMVDTIADPIERQRGLQNLRQAEAADLQLSEAKNAALLRENTQKAQALVAEQTAAGQILDVPALSKIAADTGADAQELIRGAASALNLTNAQAEAKTKKLVADINKAATSPEAFNKLLGSFDPNPDDNITPELRIGKDGMHQVFYGDKPMSPAFRGTKDISAMSLVASHYSDQVSGNPLATAVQLATLEAKRAQIAASNRASPGTPSLSQKIADAEKALGRKLTDEEKAVMVGVQGRERAPTAADINARAKLYMESDADLTPEQALAMAQKDLGGGLGSSASAPPGQVPGQPVWAPAAAPATAPAAPAATKTAAPPPVGLSRAQVGQAVTQQQTGVQAETRVRRAAITEFEQSPQVRQAYDAVRQLRRSGEAVRANNIENQINAQRERFIAARIGRGQ